MQFHLQCNWYPFARRNLSKQVNKRIYTVIVIVFVTEYLGSMSWLVIMVVVVFFLVKVTRIVRDHEKKKHENSWWDGMGRTGHDHGRMQERGEVRMKWIYTSGLDLYIVASSSIPLSLKIGPSPLKISWQGGTIMSALLVKVSLPWPCSGWVVTDNGRGDAFACPCMMALTPLAASRCCLRISGDEIHATYKRMQIIAARNVSQCYSRWSRWAIIIE